VGKGKYLTKASGKTSKPGFNSEWNQNCLLWENAPLIFNTILPAGQPVL